MLAKWGLKVNTERKDDFLNYTSCEQTQSEPGRDRVCEIASHRGQSSSSTGFLCPFPFGGSFSRLFWEFLCLWLKHSISVPGQERLESTLCQSGHLHPCASLTSWLLFTAFLPIQPTHTPWYHARQHLLVFLTHFPPPIKLVCTLTHSSQRFLPPLFCDYTERPGSSRQRWDAHRSTISEQKLRELWQPPRNPGERFSEMCHTAFPVCHEYRPCVLLRDGHCYHTNMPTFMHQRKYFTLASCSPHDDSTRFPPLTHNHNEPHWLFD